MTPRTPKTRRTHATAFPLLFIFALACATLAAPAKRTATHDGVRMTFDVTLAREATGQTVPASLLDVPSDKPDGIYPEHVAFTLVGMPNAPVLAATRDAGTHDGYTLPLGGAGRRERQRYAAYVERVRRKLERLRPAQFQPDLRLYDELLSSLEIRK